MRPLSTKNTPHEFDLVWYSPDLDEITVGVVSDGCLFYDEFGPFHSRFDRNLKNYRFYLIGAL